LSNQMKQEQRLHITSIQPQSIRFTKEL